jgi:dTDP-4-amino-4,6-dideoxygalactose transaminase
VGINAKVTELQAAMGLAVLPYMEEVFASRGQAVAAYNEALKGNGLGLLKLRKGTEWNYSYYPVIFPDESALLRAEAALNAQGVIPRRYFNPSLNTLNYTDMPEMPVSESVSSCIMCLPLYLGVKEEDIRLIVRTILNTR